jgi:hypothetical protein
MKWGFEMMMDFFKAVFGRKKRLPSRVIKRRRSAKASSLSFQLLETRNLLAGIYFSSGEVTIAGDASSNIGFFIDFDSETYRARLDGFADQDFTKASVSKVIFIGFDGDDQFTNETAVESLMLGNDGNDMLTGGPGIDVANGGNGADTIFGEGGADRLLGGLGADEIYGGGGADRIFGGDGENRLYGDDDADLIFGGADIDTISGGDGADQVFPLGGDDVVDLGDGGLPGATDPVDADLVLGGIGNDVFTGGLGLNIFYGGDGDDLFTGGDGENRMHGQNGNDSLISGASNDYLAGQIGDDTISGGGGNDYIIPGFGDDIVDAGGGNDFVVFGFAFNRFNITISGSDLVIDDTVDVEGTDLAGGTENFRFTDGDRVAQADVIERVTINPIIVSNSDGSNTAELFGTAAQEAEIKRLIDEIYLQAQVDVEWLAPQTYNNTFANIGNGGTRPNSDLTTVVNAGDSAGIGNSSSLFIDMYFVEIAAGFADTTENTANGLAYVNDNGITMHVGDNLPSFLGGRDVVARVVAHEIGHNLGLDHVSDTNNLMNDGSDLTVSQITTIVNSSFTQSF